MVGYRNRASCLARACWERIRLSDGGVSEQPFARMSILLRAYQAFRWWGIGTERDAHRVGGGSVSGFPMVGYRNQHSPSNIASTERIRLSDGGVSERAFVLMSAAMGA